MKLGLFTPVFGKLTLDRTLVELEKFPDIQQLEIGCGGWPGSDHIDVPTLLSDSAKRTTFLEKLKSRDLSISALSCHGNPVHPDHSIATRDNSTFEEAVRLAAALGVSTVVTFSGCPGGSKRDTTPNWITAAWPPEYVSALTWQWEEVLLPYWLRAASFAKNHGVRVAIEAHPGFSVYNTATMLKLRKEAGETIGMNFDPSHLWWQGIDPVAAITELKEAIFHVHAKDVALNTANIGRNGVLDTSNYFAFTQRSWTFRTVGWGHGEEVWKSIVSALRIVGYDGALSIEHEDALASVDEGLTRAVSFLKRVILFEPPAAPWWA